MSLPEAFATTVARLNFIQNGRETRRFHGLPMLDYQRVDSHLYGQMSLIPLIVGDGAVERVGRLLLACVYDGDIAEWVTGDVPAPVKRKLDLRSIFALYESEVMADAGFEEPAQLSPADQRVIKLADAVEGCLHCIVERQKGNAHPRLLWCFHEFWKYTTEEQGLDAAGWHEERGIPMEVGEKALRFSIATAWTKANGGAW